MTDISMTIRVTMMGPARVGKTTLLTAILENARALLAGTSVTMLPADPMTEERLRKNDIELTADLMAGEFRAGALSATTQVSVYHMLISPGVEGEGLRMDFLDFPGGLLTPSVRRDTRAEEWQEIELLLHVSTAMLIPVDAVVLMEPRSTDEKRAVPGILGLVDLRGVAEDWAKKRKINRDQPGTLIVSPVKCESYFTDNGGRGRDRSGDLFKRVLDVYGSVIDTVRREAPHVQIVYSPVDSIGCVELVDPRWKPTSYGLEPDPEFLVRPPGRRRVVGADDVLVPLVRQVVAAGRQSAEDISRKAEEEMARARRLANLGFWDAADQFGFWNELWARLDGVKAQRKQLEYERSATAEEALGRLDEYDAALDKIASRPQGPRARIL
ncbi:MAG: hypothetical protein ACT4NY_30735 [Pseudonocardiales bacterium]